MSVRVGPRQPFNPCGVSDEHAAAEPVTVFRPESIRTGAATIYASVAERLGIRFLNGLKQVELLPEAPQPVV